MEAGTAPLRTFETRLAALDASIAHGVADADAGRVKSTAEVFDLLQWKLEANARRR
jgi:antitoxin ParD1/3/4